MQEFTACSQAVIIFPPPILNAMMIKMVKVLREGAGLLPPRGAQTSPSFTFQGQKFLEGLVS